MFGLDNALQPQGSSIGHDLLVLVIAAARFASSIVLALLALFTVGALRSMISNGRWWRAGLEMLTLGAIVGAVAYAIGSVVASLVGER
jgi:VIT1/CCC1 family predicted Fe2+/Mn2+ transporter